MEICYRVPPEMIELMQRAREREESPLGPADPGPAAEEPGDRGRGRVPVLPGHRVHGGVPRSRAGRPRDRRRPVRGDRPRRGGGYTDGYLRGSIVRDPLFDRKNTGDNTPAFVHTRIVPGDRVRIQVDAKGAGSENMGKPRHAEAGRRAGGGQGVRAAGGEPSRARTPVRPGSSGSASAGTSRCARCWPSGR